MRWLIISYKPLRGDHPPPLPSLLASLACAAEEFGCKEFGQQDATSASNIDYKRRGVRRQVESWIGFAEFPIYIFSFFLVIGALGGKETRGRKSLQVCRRCDDISCSSIISIARVCYYNNVIQNCLCSAIR